MGPRKLFPQISSKSLHIGLWQAVSLTKCCCSLKVRVFGSPKQFGLATLLPVTTFIQTACIFLGPSHVPQYQAVHTACTFLLGVQSSTDKKLATTQDRQTPEMSGLSFFAIQSQSWDFKTQSKPNHSPKFFSNVTSKSKWSPKNLKNAAFS